VGEGVSVIVIVIVDEGEGEGVIVIVIVIVIVGEGEGSVFPQPASNNVTTSMITNVLNVDMAFILILPLGRCYEPPRVLPSS
jgi:hypothetical protein